MKRLYIIAGPNGAGKTTASYTILPEILGCREFVNADEIARGISPFSPESVSIQAGKIMLARIKELLVRGESFAFETTLASKTFTKLIKQAKDNNYDIVLLFLWLDSVELAIRRVSVRVKEGGHDILEGVIVRRYQNGLKNLFKYYLPIVDKWFLVDNSGEKFQFIAEGIKEKHFIKNKDLWSSIKQKYDEY